MAALGGMAGSMLPKPIKENSGLHCNSPKIKILNRSVTTDMWGNPSYTPERGGTAEEVGGGNSLAGGLGKISNLAKLATSLF